MDRTPVVCAFTLTIVIHLTGHALCASSSLWGVTMLSSEEGVTINVGSVDPLSGNFKNQSTTFRYLGSAASYDACSTMDQKNQVNPSVLNEVVLQSSEY
jgi:hypothetical protein